MANKGELLEKGLQGQNREYQPQVADFCAFP